MKIISKLILDPLNKSSLNWCILRKEDEILQGIENDIDLFVVKSDYLKLLEYLESTFSESGIKILRRRYMPAGISYLLNYSIVGEFQKLDIIYENTLTFFSIFSSTVIANNIVSGTKYPTLSQVASEELSLRKEMARRDFPKFLRHLWLNRYRFEGEVLVPRMLLGGYLRAYLANCRKPSGSFVTLIGPDGSGKTTISNALAKTGKQDFFSVSQHHFSINTFPRLAALKFKRGKEPDYTLPNSGTNAPIQSTKRALVYLGYYGTELLLYSHLRLKRRLRLGQLVIFDRYFHDWMFQRSHRNMPRPLMKWLLAMAVKPNLIVYLKGDPIAINARKPELSVDEISMQQTMIEQDLLSFWREQRMEIIEFDSTHQSVESIVAGIRAALTKV